VQVADYETAILANFAQFIFARQIDLHTSIHFDEAHRNNLFKFITGTGNKLEKIRITSESNQGEFCEFIVKVNIGHYSF
jgi:hypothetical protein